MTSNYDYDLATGTVMFDQTPGTPADTPEDDGFYPEARYDLEEMERVIALMDPVPNADDIDLATRPEEDDAGFTGAMREDLSQNDLIWMTSHYDCATEESQAAMWSLSYPETEKIYTTVAQLYADAQG